METERTFKIEFVYLKEHFKASVSSKNYPNGYAVYKLILKAQKFWLLNNDNEWRFVGDFELCKKLKNVITRTIKKASELNHAS